MANEKISQLPTVLNADIGVSSIIPLVDSVDSITKTMALSQFDLRWPAMADFTALSGDVTTIQTIVEGNQTANRVFAGPASGSPAAPTFRAITTADLPAGSIVQVVSTTKTDTFTSSSGSYTDITGMSVSITPSSSSNKIFVILSLQGSQDVGVERASFQLVRGATPICIGDQVGSRIQGSGDLTSFNSDLATSLSVNYLDSPATTSSTTYKVQGKTSSGGGNFFINRTDNDTNASTTVRYASTITVMEVKA